MATVFEAELYAQNLVARRAGFEILYSEKVTAARTLTVESPRFLRLDATTAPFTLTLPLSTSGLYEGMQFTLSEDAGSTNAITVAGNGANINGAANLTMNAAFRQRVLRYNGTEWVVIAGIN